MKKIFLMVLCSFSIVVVSAQCDKSVTFSSQKTQFLDGSGQVNSTRDMPTKVDVSSKHIMITPVDKVEDMIEGDVKDWQCKWEQPFKTGKTTFSAVLAKTNGETKNAVFVLESVDGILNLTVTLDGMPGKIRVMIDSYKVTD